MWSLVDCFKDIFSKTLKSLELMSTLLRVVWPDVFTPLQYHVLPQHHQVQVIPLQPLLLSLSPVLLLPKKGKKERKCFIVFQKCVFISSMLVVSILCKCTENGGSAFSNLNGEIWRKSTKFFTLGCKLISHKQIYLRKCAILNGRY